MMQKKYLLQDNIYSVAGYPRLYGAHGDEVTLIAEHGHVWIVENEKGGRSPIVSDKLVEKPPGEKKAAAEGDIKPTTAPNINKVPPRKTKKLSINNQQNLF
jgi:hypothetical protein